MVSILVEPSYSNNIWCRQLVEGLETELKYKRIPFCRIASLEELDRDTGYLYVIGSVPGWIQTVLEVCHAEGIHPILMSNRSDQRFPVNYSAVCSDAGDSMKYLVSALRGKGRERIALYGINPDSVSDVSRKAGFLQAMGLRENAHIFENQGSLENCFRGFLSRSGAYDAVICANDFAAISLVNHLLSEAPEELDRLAVIGCAETRLTKFYSKYILSVRINFNEYGKAAVSLLETLRRNPELSYIVMAVRWECSALGGVEETFPVRPTLPQTEDRFYRDSEVDDMLRVERILNESDELDGSIMRLLLEDCSNEEIAERCFVAVSTVKYRMRKMMTAAQKSSKQALKDLLRRYTRYEQ